MAGMDETAPLLGGQNSSAAIDSGNGRELAGECVVVSPITNEELPSLSLSSENSIPVITCQVCISDVELTGKQEQYVVKCSKCGEATPIKPPPSGKKYVRCPCKCLLICKTSSQKISCPRTDCKKIIQLAQSPATSAISQAPGMSHVSCGHCKNMFLFNTLTNALARCPHCRRLSTVGGGFARSRVLIYVLISLVWLILGIGFTAGPYPYKTLRAVWITIFAVCYVLFVAFLCRALYYFTMKVSTVLNCS